MPPWAKLVKSKMHMGYISHERQGKRYIIKTFFKCSKKLRVVSYIRIKSGQKSFGIFIQIIL